MKTKLGLPPSIWEMRETLAKAMGWTMAQAVGALVEIWNSAIELGETAATAGQLAAWACASKAEAAVLIVALRKVGFVEDAEDGKRLVIWLADEKIEQAGRSSARGQKAGKASGIKRTQCSTPSPTPCSTSGPTLRSTPCSKSNTVLNTVFDSAELCPKGVGGIAVKDSSFTLQILQEDSSFSASSSSQAELESRETTAPARALIESSGLRKLDDARASAAATDCRKGICYGGQIALAPDADDDAYEAALRARIAPETLALVLAAYDSCTHLRKDFTGFCDTERKRVRAIAFETLASRFDGLLCIRFKNLLSVARAALDARPDVTYEHHPEEQH